MDASIVELLNGIEGADKYLLSDNTDREGAHYSHSDDVFIDENGVPTDSFLQSIMRESSMNAKTAENSTTNPPNGDKVKDVTTYGMRQSYTSDSSSSDRDSDSWKDYIQETSGSRTLARKMSHRRTKNSASKPSKRPSKRLYDPTTQCTRRPSQHKGNAVNARSGSKVRKTAKCSVYGALAGDCCVGASFEKHAPTLGPGGQQSLSQAQAEEAGQKIKALKLRIQGQLQCIRTLETQLSEATHNLTLKDTQLQEAFKRLLVLEKRERLRQRAAADEDKALAVGVGHKRTEESKMYQLKTELVALQAQLSEEQARRHRSEERLQLMKNYVEKTKDRAQTAEQTIESQKLTISELETKLQRLRREFKGSQAAVNAEKARAVEGETELFKVQQRADRAEKLVREVRQDVDRYKEEARLLRMELSAADDRSRRCQLELEVLRERKTARLAEDRLRDLHHRTFRADPDSRSFYETSYDGSDIGETRRASRKRSTSVPDYMRRYYKDTDCMSTSTMEMEESEHKTRRSGRKMSTLSNNSFTERTRPRFAFDDIDSNVSSSRERDRRKSGDRQSEVSLSDARDLLGERAGARDAAHLDENSVTSSSNPLNTTGASAASGVKDQYDRLQKMYERVTGKQSKGGDAKNYF